MSCWPDRRSPTRPPGSSALRSGPRAARSAAHPPPPEKRKPAEQAILWARGQSLGQRLGNSALVWVALGSGMDQTGGSNLWAPEMGRIGWKRGSPFISWCLDLDPYPNGLRSNRANLPKVGALAILF